MTITIIREDAEAMEQVSGRAGIPRWTLYHQVVRRCTYDHNIIHLYLPALSSSHPPQHGGSVLGGTSHPRHDERYQGDLRHLPLPSIRAVQLQGLVSSMHV